jgi:hypothetical protein
MCAPPRTRMIPTEVSYRCRQFAGVLICKSSGCRLMKDARRFVGYRCRLAAEWFSVSTTVKSLRVPDRCSGRRARCRAPPGGCSDQRRIDQVRINRLFALAIGGPQTMGHQQSAQLPRKSFAKQFVCRHEFSALWSFPTIRA